MFRGCQGLLKFDHFYIVDFNLGLISEILIQNAFLFLEKLLGFLLEYLIICICANYKCWLPNKFERSRVWAMGIGQMIGQYLLFEQSSYFDFWTSWKGTIIWSPFRLSPNYNLLLVHFLTSQAELVDRPTQVCQHTNTRDTAGQLTELAPQKAHIAILCH